MEHNGFKAYAIKIFSGTLLASAMFGCASTPEHITAKATVPIVMHSATTQVKLQLAMSDDWKKLYSKELVEALNKHGITVAEEGDVPLIVVTPIFAGTYEVYNHKMKTGAPLSAGTVTEEEEKRAESMANYSAYENVQKTFGYGMTPTTIALGTVYNATTDALLQTGAYQLVTDLYTPSGRTRIYADVFDDGVDYNSALPHLAHATGEKIAIILSGEKAQK